MKFTLFLVIISSVAAWGPSRPAFSMQQHTRVFSLDDDSDCFTWQDVYEFDAPLSHCNEQMFIAAEWVKSMPCAKGIEVGFLSSIFDIDRIRSSHLRFSYLLAHNQKNRIAICLKS